MLITCKTADWINSLSDPLLATTLLTFTCSNDCVFCGPSEKRIETKGISAATPGVLEWLDRCGDAGAVAVVFSGAADPFTHSGLPQFIAKARTLGIHPFCYTQAHVGASKVKAVVDAGLTEIMVSVHGHDADTHERNTRSKGSFARTMKGLQLLKDAGLYVMTNTVVTKHNVNRLQELLELLAFEYDVDEMAFSFPRVEGSVKKNLDCIPPHAAAAQALTPVLERLRDAGKRATVEYMPYCHLSPALYDEMPDAQTMYKDEFYDLVVRPSEVEWHYPESCMSCSHRLTGCQGVDKSLPFQFQTGPLLSHDSRGAEFAASQKSRVTS